MKKFIKTLRDGWTNVTERPRSQIGELDGLRAFAVLLVIITHCSQAWQKHGGPATRALQLPFVQGGWVGVDLFFCLSGYFIGRQLWKEFDQTGTIQIGRFILRRGFRIWPLYFILFLLFWLFQTFVVHTNGVPWPELTFLSNYFPQEFVYVPGSWSLATEEQFYIVIPIVVYLLTRAFRKLRSGQLLFVSLLILSPLIRWIVWRGVYHPGDVEWRVILRYLYMPFHTHLDGLLVGMLLSNLSVAKKLEQKGPNGPKWATLVGVLLVGAVLRKINHVYFEYTFLAMGFGGVIWFCLTSGPNFLRKFLGSKVFYMVSRLSYGMYLLHQAPLDTVVEWVTGNLTFLPAAAQFFLAFGLTVAATMFLAFFGFALIEQPFLNLRHKLGLETSPKPTK